MSDFLHLGSRCSQYIAREGGLPVQPGNDAAPETWAVEALAGKRILFRFLDQDLIHPALTVKGWKFVPNEVELGMICWHSPATQKFFESDELKKYISMGGKASTHLTRRRALVNTLTSLPVLLDFQGEPSGRKVDVEVVCQRGLTSKEFRHVLYHIAGWSPLHTVLDSPSTLL